MSVVRAFFDNGLPMRYQINHRASWCGLNCKSPLNVTQCQSALPPSTDLVDMPTALIRPSSFIRIRDSRQSVFSNMWRSFPSEWIRTRSDSRFLARVSCAYCPEYERQRSQVRLTGAELLSHFCADDPVLTVQQQLPIPHLPISWSGIDKIDTKRSSLNTARISWSEAA